MLLIYWTILTLIWSVPIGILLFPWGVYSAFFVLAPPILLAQLMSKPIWGSKSFFSWAKCQLKFLFSPRRYYDGKGIKKLWSWSVSHTYTVSRRKDYFKLYSEIKAEVEKNKKKTKKKRKKK